MNRTDSCRSWFRKAESHIKEVKHNPDFQTAYEPLARQKRHAANPYTDGPKPKLIRLGANKDLAHLGVGVQLYFILLKHLIILLLIIGMIQLPQALTSFNGNMLRLYGIYKTVVRQGLFQT
eukprot:Blabericola_migrator_1__1105@NODE_1282_length_4905_cov_121_272427_g866_i0_p5_GENE_NODE_1282_length_4905_cov_121_272427_g866_i0NODE_1282_length_4905_cov_121_272427_g866_i0_p5_ORF_typecomplete_len121_score16_80_NODE_1282_length_4905_cov_121_272427_g866_i028073169